jgi:hypothetical protein
MISHTMQVGNDLDLKWTMLCYHVNLPVHAQPATMDGSSGPLAALLPCGYFCLVGG